MLASPLRQDPILVRCCMQSLRSVRISLTWLLRGFANAYFCHCRRLELQVHVSLLNSLFQLDIWGIFFASNLNGFGAARRKELGFVCTSRMPGNEEGHLEVAKPRSKWKYASAGNKNWNCQPCLHCLNSCIANILAIVFLHDYWN